MHHNYNLKSYKWSTLYTVFVNRAVFSRHRNLYICLRQEIINIFRYIILINTLIFEVIIKYVKKLLIIHRIKNCKILKYNNTYY